MVLTDRLDAINKLKPEELRLWCIVAVQLLYDEFLAANFEMRLDDAKRYFDEVNKS